MKLCRQALKNISSENVIIPNEKVFDLPESVLQFGTGRLLRGLPDYFINKANSSGIFNGRIVIVKTTGRGDIAAFEKQDNLYTVCERGIIDGKKVEENIINASVSRVLSANNDWTEILQCAHNEELKIIVSNTTEIGIQLVNDNIHSQPPVSFPGKLLALLYERFIAFNGKKESGFVIVPTELITDNAKKLETIVLKLAQANSLESDFITWITGCNYFCNSLVDRIVTGMPEEKIKNEIERKLGYEDDLMIVSEVYSLWAIEGDEKIRSILSFSKADDGVVIESNIDLHRELKLRLLNGTHTITCGVAFLSNCDTVQHAMGDESLSNFISDVMNNEIAPSIPYEISEEAKETFIKKVMDRFRNPHIHHLWKNITLNYTSKMALRCVPLLLNYYKQHNNAPQMFALGFAAYLYFMKAVKQTGKDFYGEFDSQFYLIDDELAGKFYSWWKSNLTEEVVTLALKDDSLWGQDLSQLPDFKQTVLYYLNSIAKNGMKSTLAKMNHKKNVD